MDTGFYPASGSLEEIIPYMLLLIVFIWDVVHSTCSYYKIVVMNMRCPIDLPGLGLYNTPEA